jgi:DNA-binding protein HU-beta
MAVNTVGKSDLVDVVAEKTGLSKKDSAAALDAAIGAVTCALKRGDKVQLTGFGVFEVRTRQARKGKNLHTGEVIDIAESKVPAFKAGKGLKDAVK